ncbi:acyl carrier protein [Streptomyces sp. L2]|uniref:acyl carrier protein n=1 Tax=Streptomyces sp. L2 TaxID=2162665 RepID=UPI0010135F21|nr:acyl carrier protein [Streptomyces sp. L2]
MSSLYEIVVEALVTQFHQERDRLRPDTSFRDLGFDSLSRLDLSLALSKQLKIELQDEDVFRQRTLGELVRFLEEQRAAA